MTQRIISKNELKNSIFVSEIALSVFIPFPLLYSISDYSSQYSNFHLLLLFYNSYQLMSQLCLLQSFFSISNNWYFNLSIPFIIFLQFVPAYLLEYLSIYCYIQLFFELQLFAVVYLILWSKIHLFLIIIW